VGRPKKGAHGSARKSHGQTQETDNVTKGEAKSKQARETNMSVEEEFD
jgi:hypothetical protein